MTRYDWPAGRGGNPDNARKRAAYVRAYRQLGPPDVHEGAVAERRAAVRAAPALAPGGDDRMWVPVGPTSVLGGQARFSPRVSGRVSDVAVSPDGERVYAATAGGGVWYSSDAGSTWLPVGAWAGAVRAEVTTRVSPLSTGCLLVGFGADPNGADDDVYVGTGELAPSAGAIPGGQLGGIGVLFAHGPVPHAIADPLGNPWQREGKNLTGFGIYRLAFEPGGTNRIVAATSHGLYTRTGAPTADADWTKVSVAPFDEADTNLSASEFRCTDLAWTAQDAHDPSIPPRLYVGVTDIRGAFLDDDSGLWVSEHGVDGPFTSIGLSGKDDGSRYELAVAPSNPRVLYVLGKGPHLWRVEAETSAVGDIKARAIAQVPANLFGRGTKDQSHYDIALAVHPENDDEVVLGGKSVYAGDHNAALFRCVVLPDGSGLKLDYAVPEKDDKRDESKQAADPTFIGEGIHPDVHQIRWQLAGARRDLWVACDGGLFRSRANGDRGTFVARNTGMATLEPGYVAGHPTNDVAMLVGTQDNGVLRRVGDSVWRLALYGDGGGVAFHPRSPNRIMGQYAQASWRDENQSTIPMVKRSAGEWTDSETTENEGSSFYSGIAVRDMTAGPVRTAVGTVRVWLTEDFGRTWVTLPSNEDPRRGSAGDFRQNWKDDVPFLPFISWFADPPPAAAVVAPRWVDDNRLLVLCRGAVFLFDYDLTRAKPWRRTLIEEYTQPSCSTIKPADLTSPADHLMPIGRWSDLAVHLPAKGSKGTGSFYVTTTGPPKGEPKAQAPNADSLWWYDGTGKWYPTGLRTAADGIAAPAYAVAVDPWNAEVVYVGTSVGVWRGTYDDGPDGTPAWDWSAATGNGPMVNGLPEAAVQDLSFFERQGAQPLLLLRAALQARGVWEVDLRQPLTARTYLRVHEFDSRRVLPAALPTPGEDLGDPGWNASPDIRVRPAPGAPPRPAQATFPWRRTTGFADHERAWLLWIFQTALRRLDPLVRPDGTWTEAFDERVTARRAALALPTPTSPILDAALWNAVLVAPNLYADPWDGEPNEADLQEFVRDRDAAGPASVGILAGPNRVDVLVHHRHGRAAPAGDVYVTVVSAELPTSSADWAAVPVPWTADVAALLRNNGVPPGGWTQPAGWLVGSGTVASRTPSGPLVLQPTRAVDPRSPRPVTFTLDFTGAALGTSFVIVAVVHSAADPVVLTGATLRDLVFNNHHVAARSVGT